jgi:hypothetical protein
LIDLSNESLVASAHFGLVHVGIQIGNFRLDYYADNLVHVRNNLAAKTHLELPIATLSADGVDSIDDTEANLRTVTSVTICSDL